MNDRDALAARRALAFDTQGQLRSAIVVEHCIKFGGYGVLIGWLVDSAANCGIVIRDETLSIGAAPCSMHRFARPDVDNGYALAPGTSAGFVAIVATPSAASTEPQQLEIRLSSSASISARIAVASDALALESSLSVLQHKLGFLLSSMMDDKAAILALLPLIRNAKRASSLAVGHIESARCIPDLGALVIGWAVSMPQSKLVLLTDDGRTRALDQAVRWQRPDILSAYSRSFGQFSAAAGYLSSCIGPTTLGSQILLVSIEGENLATIAESNWASAPQDSISFAQWSFDIATPASTIAFRMENHDGLLVDQLRKREVEYRKSRSASVTEFGPSQAKPKFSIIVPIRSRFEAVHNQFIEMEEDAELISESEIIYVVDDPDTHSRFLRDAPHMQTYYGVPFKIVGGFELGGMAGAMNIGASVSRAPILVFIRSSVIPTAPGWLKKMYAALEADDSIGAVGSRLLHSSGAIRHDGMAFHWDSDVANYVLRSIGEGEAPTTSQPGALRKCDAVSTVCMMTPRGLFKEVDGFDESIVLPLFIAADFSLRLKSKGYGVTCVQDTSIVSLDMPSDWLAGTEAFQNCFRNLAAHKQYQNWKHLLPSAPGTGHESSNYLPSAS